MAAKKVGTLIREARTAKKLSQEQLAAQVDGLSGSDIGKAERGEKDLSQAQLKTIAKVLGVTQKSLLEAPKGGSAAAAAKTSSAARSSTSGAAKKTTKTSTAAKASSSAKSSSTSAAKKTTASKTGSAAKTTTAKTTGAKLPEHVTSIEAEGIEHVKLIDASPIGINIRSTVATYANVHDELRKIYARTPDAKQLGWKAGDFSYNTGRLRCPVCDGTGSISLDVQFLPDVDIPCPECKGSRYAKDAYRVRCRNKAGEERSLPELMDMDINTAIRFCKDMKTVAPKLAILQSLGLGYLTLGEETPSLSGGEAQRLKLASEMGRIQTDSVFVFDEPTIGLHPRDVQTLLDVLHTLIDNGATVVVIEHDLDIIRSADHIIDMGPGGGDEGGLIIATGTPADIRRTPGSKTGKYI